MTTTVYGKVIRNSSHGDHATVVIAPDLEDERNDAWAHKDDANGVAGDMLALKVGRDAMDATDLVEGSDVTITFAAQPKGTAKKAAPPAA